MLIINNKCKQYKILLLHKLQVNVNKMIMKALQTFHETFYINLIWWTVASLIN